MYACNLYIIAFLALVRVIMVPPKLYRIVDVRTRFLALVTVTSMVPPKLYRIVDVRTRFLALVRVTRTQCGPTQTIKDRRC